MRNFSIGRRGGGNHSWLVNRPFARGAVREGMNGEEEAEEFRGRRHYAAVEPVPDQPAANRGLDAPSRAR